MSLFLSALAISTVLAIASGQFHRTVFVMRHCVRSTYLDFYPDQEPYPSYNNYSSTPFPTVC